MRLTDFNKIEFDSKRHTYRYDGVDLLSATSLVKALTPPFDHARVLQLTAARDGVSAEEIQRRWNLKRDAALDKGVRVHAGSEDVMNGREDHVLRQVNDWLPEMRAFYEVWKRLRTNLDVQLIKTEMMLGDVELRVAGRADALISIMCPARRRVLCLFDWKTGKFTDRGFHETLLPPFDDILNCHLARYSIQLSVYRLVLERNLPDQEFGDAYLAHLRSDGSHHLYRAIDFRERLLPWLATGGHHTALVDQDAERHAEKVCALLGGMDERYFRRLSPEMSQRFLDAAARPTALASGRCFADPDEAE